MTTSFCVPFSYPVIAIVFIVICYFRDYFKSVLVALKVPGPPASPISGHVILMNNGKKMIEFGSNMSYLYGSIVKLWVYILPIFIITEPSHIRIILSSSKYSTKNMFYRLLTSLIGEGLVTLTGDKWQLHRRLIQPYFRVNILKIFFNCIHKHSSDLVHKFKNETDYNIVLFANEFVLNALHEIVFGIPLNNNRETAIFRSRKVSIFEKFYKPWLMFNKIFNAAEAAKKEIELKNNLQQYIKQLIKERIKKLQECEESRKNNNSLMDMMIEISENDPDFTEKDVIDETAAFVLVGQDSMATAVAFALYFLAAHQNVQAKVVEELKEIYSDDDHTDTFEDIMEMKYLQQCIKESLRLCPSIPLMARTLTKEVRLGKQTFPVGSNIIVSPFVTHRLPHIFPNPLEYNPDRFSPENKENIDPYGYIPFSAGPRNCIGYKLALMELKIVISHILRNYHISLTPGHEELNLWYSNVSLRAKGGIWLRFQERQIK